MQPHILLIFINAITIFEMYPDSIAINHSQLIKFCIVVHIKCIVIQLWSEFTQVWWILIWILFSTSIRLRTEVVRKYTTVNHGWSDRTNCDLIATKLHIFSHSCVLISDGDSVWLPSGDGKATIHMVVHRFLQVNSNLIVSWLKINYKLASIHSTMYPDSNIWFQTFVFDSKLWCLMLNF